MGVWGAMTGQPPRNRAEDSAERIRIDNVSIDEFIRNRRLRGKTPALYRYILHEFARFVEVNVFNDAIKAADSYLDMKCQNGTRYTTANLYASILQSFFRHALKMPDAEIADIQPSSKDKQETKDRTIDLLANRDDLIKIFHFAQGEQELLLACLLITTGARITEIQKLQYYDIKFYSDNLVVVDFMNEKQVDPDARKKVPISDPEIIKTIYIVEVKVKNKYVSSFLLRYG